MDRATDGEELTDGQARAVLKKLIDYQTANRLTDADMGRILGCGGSSSGRSRWNRIKRGNYPPGPARQMLARGRAILAALDERLAEAAEQYVETSIGRQILAVCHRAMNRTTIGLVVAPSGAGKTIALRQFARRVGYQAVYVHAGEANACKGELVREIARQLGLKHRSTANFSGCYRIVREHLAGLYAGGRGAGAILLVDEATTLRPNSLNFLRNLHDDPSTRVPLVLADTWRLHDELHRTGRLPGGYEQLRSRAGAQYRLGADREAADEPLIPRKDAEAVAASIVASLGGGRLSAAAARYLTRIAQADGTLRNVAQRLVAVADVAAAGREAPTYSVAQLDEVAPLVGMAPENPNCASAFGHGGPAPARRSA